MTQENLLISRSLITCAKFLLLCKITFTGSGEEGMNIFGPPLFWLPQYLYIHLFIHTYIIHVYVHAHTYTHIHAYTHTYQHRGKEKDKEQHQKQQKINMCACRTNF